MILSGQFIGIVKAKVKAGITKSRLLHFVLVCPGGQLPLIEYVLSGFFLSSSALSPNIIKSALCFARISLARIGTENPRACVLVGNAASLKSPQLFSDLSGLIKPVMCSWS